MKNISIIRIGMNKLTYINVNYKIKDNLIYITDGGVGKSGISENITDIIPLFNVVKIQVGDIK